VIQTEQAETAGYAMQCFARCGVQGGVCRREHASGPVYEFKIEDAACVARMHALFGTTGRETSLQIDPGLIRSRDSVRDYVGAARSDEHTSELQSRCEVVCRPLLATKGVPQERWMSHAVTT